MERKALRIVAWRCIIRKTLVQQKAVSALQELYRPLSPRAVFIVVLWSAALDIFTHKFIWCNPIIFQSILSEVVWKFSLLNFKSLLFASTLLLEIKGWLRIEACRLNPWGVQRGGRSNFKSSTCTSLSPGVSNLAVILRLPVWSCVWSSWLSARWVRRCRSAGEVQHVYHSSARWQH